LLQKGGCIIKEVMLSVNRYFLLAILALLSGFTAASANAAQALRPFTSDGCSVFPDGTWQQQQLWQPCCVAHDLAYWQGGTEAQRLAADEAMQQCVSTIGEPEIASVMLAGVRVGGTPFLPTPFRWGYGWSEFRGYQALSSEELSVIATSLALHPLRLSVSPQPSPAAIIAPAANAAAEASIQELPAAIPVQ
jgi:hypothetical protein